MVFLRMRVACCILLPCMAQAAETDEVVRLINAYRTTPAACGGHMSPVLPPLQAKRALAAVRLGPGRFLQQDLASAGYPSLHAEAIGLGGVSTAADVFQLLRQQHCTSLRNPELTDIGVSNARDGWTIILAREDVIPPLPPQPESTRLILEATNRARATARICGTQAFPAAPPLTANPALDAAALGHSSEMATLRYFSHAGKDGSQVSDRATRAGYAWHDIGENIASGMRTPDEAVAGWIASPGHCANLMNAHFTEMGSGYGKSAETGIVFWTQVFGRRK